jgi:poly(3-hydroxybutyrate) depolymerase
VGDLVSADQQGAELTELTIDSDAVGERLPVNVVVPQGAEDDPGRPLLVFLHGRADNGDGQDSNLNDEMYAALADQAIALRSSPSPQAGRRLIGMTVLAATGGRT